MLVRRAFTVIELLVVISIITLLISILAPSLRSSREAARSVKCLSQLHQLGLATDNFTVEHHDRLPGAYGEQWVNLTVPDGGCWLSNPTGSEIPWTAAPHTGVLWRYTGRDPAIYRCPSLPTGTLGSGVNSNGKFDYSALHAFVGARMYNTPKSSTIALADYSFSQIRTPWIVEESPFMDINLGHIEGGFGHGDLIGNWHNGGTNLVSIDGSGVALQNANNLSSWSFTAITPSGQSVSLATHWTGWGGWDKR